jgi:hypothetical protein
LCDWELLQGQLAARKAASREFVLIMRQRKLVGERFFKAINGAFSDRNASKASIRPRNRLAKRGAACEADEAAIKAYRADLEANDSAAMTTTNSLGGAGARAESWTTSTS